MERIEVSFFALGELLEKSISVPMMSLKESLISTESEESLDAAMERKIIRMGERGERRRA